ncbi:MAG: hypothetical protein J7501_18455 [Bdellovibrio sp.]|nr:hypothetical protein [Bdellovibrio sp.]
MKEKLRSGHFLAAVIGLLVGVCTPWEVADPKEPTQELKQKMRDYYRVGNYQGLLDISKHIPKNVPRYKDIDELRRVAENNIQYYKNKKLPTDRMPAAVRDSYYDAFLAMDRGECFDAYQNMIVVRKYTQRALDEAIYSLCKSRREPASEKINRVLILFPKREIWLTENKSK